MKLFSVEEMDQFNTTFRLRIFELKKNLANALRRIENSS